LTHSLAVKHAEEGADTCPGGLDALPGGLTQEGLELGEELFDRVATRGNRSAERTSWRLRRVTCSPEFPPADG